MEAEISEFEKQLEKIFEDLRTELLSIRTGRITPALVENLQVEVYGGSTKLKLLELATIVNQDPQTLLISPFDPSTLQEIEKALKTADLGATPQVQGQRIYLKFPPLTEEQRQKFVKVVGEVVEEHKKRVRGARDEVRKKVRIAFDENEITEDLKFSLFKRIDEITKKQTEKIENLKEKKIEEITSL